MLAGLMNGFDRLLERFNDSIVSRQLTVAASGAALVVQDPNGATALAGHTTATMTDRYIRLREVPVVEGPAFNPPAAKAG